MYKWGVVVSMFHETAHSIFVRERLLPCRVAVGSIGLYRVHGLRVSSFWPAARWHFLPPLSFQRLGCFVCCSSFSFLSRHVIFLFYWPFHTRLISCLIRAALLHCLFVCICSYPDALWSVVLISDLLYQSAAFVFPDGSLVSELVMVSLAFHLFVVGTVIFLCALTALTVVVPSFVADSGL